MLQVLQSVALGRAHAEGAGDPPGIQAQEELETDLPRAPAPPLVSRACPRAPAGSSAGQRHWPEVPAWAGGVAAQPAHRA